MRIIAQSLTALAMVASATLLVAQPPAPPGRDGGRGQGRDVVAVSVARMMAFDGDQDGKLTKSEVSDRRLAALFDRADENKDAVLTREELTALFTREAASLRRGGPGGPRRGPPPGGERFGPPPVDDETAPRDRSPRGRRPPPPSSAEE